MVGGAGQDPANLAVRKLLVALMKMATKRNWVPPLESGLRSDALKRSLNLLGQKTGRLAPVIALILCMIRLLRLVDLYSVNVFIGDHWFYHDPTLFRRVSWWAVFRWESNPWREGLGGLLSLWVEPVFRWNSRAESFIETSLLIVGCILAVWLKTRLIRPLEFWDFLIPLVVLTPASYETTVVSTHFSHGPLPLILLMGISLAWTVPNAIARYALIALLTALSVSTGFGFIAGIIVPFLLLAEIYREREKNTLQHLRIVSLLVIGLAWSLFLIGYSTVNTGCPADRIHTSNPFNYFLFVAFMFVNVMGLKASQHFVPAIIFGSLLLVFVIAMWASSVRNQRSPVPCLLISFSLAFALATALGRMCLGLGTAVGSRYVIYLVPAFVGIYLLTLSLERNRRMLLLLVLTGLGLLGPGITHVADREQMVATRSQRANWKICYLSKHDLVGCNKLTGATDYTYPDTIQEKLDFLERAHLNLFAD